MSEYRVIVSDLDGTLLNDDKMLSKESVSLLNQLIAKGHSLVIATGRRYWSARRLTSELMGDYYIVANNGAIVRSAKEDRLLCKAPLAQEVACDLIGSGMDRGMSPIIFVNAFEKGYDILLHREVPSEAYMKYIQSEKRFKFYRTMSELSGEEILEVAFTEPQELLVDFVSEVVSRHTGALNYHMMQNFPEDFNFLEIIGPKTDKWTAVQELLHLLNISNAQAIAFGDNLNDLSMIRGSGFGIAMKNAVVELKECADIISSYDNNDSGVVRELKKIFDL